MKCFNCGKNEAVFSEDCLVVEHKVSDFMNTRMESERLVGVTRAGLCPRCLNAAALRVSRARWGGIFRSSSR